MNKSIILMLLILMIIPSVSALLNTTQPIFADYSENGVLSDANARLSIIDSDGKIMINNVSMDEISKGRFFYNYTCNKTGNYNAVVLFYSKITASMLGNDIKPLECGGSNRMSLLSCPSSTLGFVSEWLFLLILLIVGISGLAFSSTAMMLLSGIVLFFFSISLWGCGELVSYLAIGLGIVFMGIGVSIRK